MIRLLKLLVSAILIALAFYMLDIQTIIKTIKTGSAISFISAVMLNILSFFIMGIRWNILITPVIRWPIATHMAIYLKGTFLNTFTPANMGGDAYRLAVLRKEMVTDRMLVKLLLRERVIGLYSYLIIFVLAYSFAISTTNFDESLTRNPYIYGVILAFVMFLLPFVIRWLGERFDVLVRGIIGKERIPGLYGLVDVAVSLLSVKGVLPLMLLTIGGILLWLVSIKIIAEGFDISVPLIHLAVVATLVELVRLIPITIQGIGLREGLFAYLLTFWGHSPEQSFVVGMLAYLALSVAIVLCGPIGQVMALRTRIKKG